MTTIKDLMLYEEVLLRIEKRYNTNEIKLPFDLLISLKQELKKLASYTDIYLEEVKRIEGFDDEEERLSKMENTTVLYDSTNYLKIINSEEVASFFSK